MLIQDDEEDMVLMEGGRDHNIIAHKIHSDSAVLRTPNKKNDRKHCVTGMDDFDKSAIRCQKEVPTLHKLSSSLQSAGLFCDSLPSLSKILK